MSRKPKTIQEIVRVKIGYRCNGVFASCTVDDIKAWESECELCGTHGEINIIVKRCPVCSQEHEINYKGW